MSSSHLSMLHPIPGDYFVCVSSRRRPQSIQGRLQLDAHCFISDGYEILTSFVPSKRSFNVIACA
jgi:hypothetical protein